MGREQEERGRGEKKRKTMPHRIRGANLFREYRRNLGTQRMCSDGWEGKWQRGSGLAYTSSYGQEQDTYFINTKMTSFVSTFWQSPKIFGIHKVQVLVILKGFCAMKAKNKGRLIRTGRNITSGYGTVGFYNVV